MLKLGIKKEKTHSEYLAFMIEKEKQISSPEYLLMRSASLLQDRGLHNRRNYNLIKTEFNSAKEVYIYIRKNPELWNKWLKISREYQEVFFKMQKAGLFDTWESWKNNRYQLRNYRPTIDRIAGGDSSYSKGNITITTFANNAAAGGSKKNMVCITSIHDDGFPGVPFTFEFKSFLSMQKKIKELYPDIKANCLKKIVRNNNILYQVNNKYLIGIFDSDKIKDKKVRDIKKKGVKRISIKAGEEGIYYQIQ